MDGPSVSRWCEACHEPIDLFQSHTCSGKKEDATCPTERQIRIQAAGKYLRLVRSYGVRSGRARE